MQVTECSYKFSEVLLCSVEICICIVQKKITLVYTKILFYTHITTKYTAVKNNGWAEDLLGKKIQKTILKVSSDKVTSIGCL